MNRAKISGFSAVRIESAVAQLIADHRHVEACFARYHLADDEARWNDLLQTALLALKVHMRLEEDIFYPAYLAATKNAGTRLHDTLAEHAMASEIIADLENHDPADWYYETKVHTLWKVVRPHMALEESLGGMLDVTQLVGVDLLSLGYQMTVRREELMEMFSPH